MHMGAFCVCIFVYLCVYLWGEGGGGGGELAGWISMEMPLLIYGDLYFMEDLNFIYLHLYEFAVIWKNLISLHLQTICTLM